IQIIARRYIEVRGGKLTARGLAAPDDADLAAAEGDCKVGEACVPENCTEGDGRAGASGDSDAPGATRGGSQGGDGGRGGGGSGGMIYLEAPRIVLSADAELDVSGSEGASNGGLIGVRGLIEGAALAPGGVAEGLFCHTDR
ncbi:MAG: hypothetical protein KC620_16210, partial [Myxococcales bacterium]|nr:hypothetical protein [Myxococcales bacterium]